MASLLARAGARLSVAALIALAAPSVASASFGDSPLRRGDVGHDVRVLQSWLTLEGFATPVDGQFGPRTAVAVRRFERREGLAIDGAVSRADAQRLRALIEQTADDAPPPQTTPARQGVATLTPDRRTAVAPADAPAEVRAAVAAANALTHKPYVYGGGHGRWNDRGYDCSGTVSYVLHSASLLATPLDSGGLSRWGSPGPGRWISVYGNRTHAYMTVAGLRFDTSGSGEAGPRWRPQPRSSRGFTVRHPTAL